MSSMRLPLLALACLLSAACSSEVPEPTGKEKDLASQSTDFAFKLHGEVLRRNGGKNVFISPASILFALLMVASGARGTTSEEMLGTLEVKGWKREDLDASCGVLLRWLQGSEPQIRLEVANSAWIKQGYPFEPQYLKDLDKFYRAKATALDFGNPASLQAINDWVKERTQGKIDKAGPQRIEPLNRLFLVNAVYFKGAWERKFEKRLTREQPFHLDKKNTRSVSFMRRNSNFKYLEAPGYQAVRIPYGEKDRMAFYVFLPKEGVTLLQLHDQLKGLGRPWVAGFAWNGIQLELPRFKLEFETELTSVLETLGMKTAFGLQADFSGISPRPQGSEVLSISAVYHKTYVEVNEEGTEAAAVTTVAVGAKSAEPPPAIVFKVDRPFLCAIVDDATGAILFTGSIVDP